MGYQVETNTGEIINVPRDPARTRYESIKEYGLQAVLERARRTRAYKKLATEKDSTIRAIICPNGERVTQF